MLSCKNFELKLTEAIPRLALSILEPPTLELKPLLENLKYAFVAQNEKLPVIIAKDLQPEQEEKLLNILRQNMKAIGWTLADILGISPFTCMRRIRLEEGKTSKATLEKAQLADPRCGEERSQQASSCWNHLSNFR